MSRQFRSRLRARQNTHMPRLPRQHALQLAHRIRRTLARYILALHNHIDGGGGGGERPVAAEIDAAVGATANVLGLDVEGVEEKVLDLQLVLGA